MTDDLSALADRIEAVLAGLTEAQRSVVMYLSAFPNWQWRASSPEYPTVQAMSGAVRVGLADKNGVVSMYRLTPLGLALRARAQQEGQR